MGEKKIDQVEWPVVVQDECPDGVGESGHRLSVTERRVSVVVDHVFGKIGEGGPNYRNVSCIGTAALMMKVQIGPGVLSIPAVFDVLGMIPGIIVLITIAVITTWSSYMIGVFKLRHRSVYGIDDVGQLLFGRIGRETLAAAFLLFWIFGAGACMLSISIGLNAVFYNGACTAVFVAVAAIVGFGLGSIQTLHKISWLAWVGLVCILTAIFTVTIAVGVQDRPAAAPTDGVFQSDYKLINRPSFTDAISASSSLVFAYGSVPAFFSIVCEMRDPRHYTRSLLICQTGVTLIYITIGVVVYYFCGSHVASPAMGSAGTLVKKLGYGFALPGLFVSTTLVIHIAAKYIFVRALRGTRHLTENTPKHWATWISCTGGISIVAYVVASAVPVFGGLVSLIGALFCTLTSFQPMGCMWLYDNWGRFKAERTPRLTLMVCWSVFVIVSGTFLMIGGTYGSVVEIIDSYNTFGGSAAWTCADNSN
ncbi:hypothetical protein PV04_03019 [Phialophora macrospora]|uniref:Amino acid transporter transmembrane domain-containing protein n=1 Tax=Phialophora macrospora TaxID=1851006 RepID=A0A0D2FR01_9EURO|nr:hypothetical protein PV04_03019 [Phialophora macrospora]